MLILAWPTLQPTIFISGVAGLGVYNLREIFKKPR